MKLARHRQAHTAAITDATLSEVAKLAKIKLYYSSNSPAFVRSHTALLSIIRAPAPAGRARDEACPPPPGPHGGDHRCDALRGRQAGEDQALLLVQQPGVRALAHRAAEHHPGARTRWSCAR